MKAIEALFNAPRTAALKGKPLKLGQAAAIVIVISIIILLYDVEGIHDILAGRRLHALLYCGLAALMLMMLPIHVYTFLRVKKGVKVFFVNPLPLVGVLRVPLSVKVALVGSLTMLVSAVSYLSLSSFYLVPHVPLARKFVMLDIGFNFFLWVVVAFAWYLFVVLHQQEVSGMKAALKQGKDVWPPAPSVPDGRNKD